jgi:HEPN domain-containing protein/predicted nucleotidyltransferase
MAKYPLKKYKVASTTYRFRSWFEQAGFDLEASNLSRANKFYEWACYQAVQSAEKTFKAIIMHAGWQPPKTHKLSVLISLCNNVDPSFRKIKFRFRELEVYTFIARYPFAIPDQNLPPHLFITEQEASECINQASVIKDFTTRLLAKPFKNPSYQDFENIAQINIENRIQESVGKIVLEFDPDEIYLFGSYARNGDHLSTLDLLVVTQTKLNYIERIRRVREITKGGIPVIEPIVYTPKELDTLLRIENDLFLENAMKEGRLVYRKGLH